jgi:hypothetical protein
MTEILEFEYYKNEFDFYSFQIPAVTPTTHICNYNCFNAPVYKNNILSGDIRFNETSIINAKNLKETSTMVTVRFNDEFNSSLSWLMTDVTQTDYFSPGSKYIINLVSGSGIYINKKGIIVIDVYINKRKVYVKFD